MTLSVGKSTTHTTQNGVSAPHRKQRNIQAVRNFYLFAPKINDKDMFLLSSNRR